MNAETWVFLFRICLFCLFIVVFVGIGDLLHYRKPRARKPQRPITWLRKM